MMFRISRLDARLALHRDYFLIYCASPLLHTASSPVPLNKVQYVT
jgi:hypothetical protein